MKAVRLLVVVVAGVTLTVMGCGGGGGHHPTVETIGPSPQEKKVQITTRPLKEGWLAVEVVCRPQPKQISVLWQEEIVLFVFYYPQQQFALDVPDVEGLTLHVIWDDGDEKIIPIVLDPQDPQ